MTEPEVHKIIPALLPLAEDIEAVTHHPDNPRRGDVPAIIRSLKRFGQQRPIVAQADGTVIAGNHVLAAVTELGWSKIAVVWVDLPESEARAYLAADNGLSDLGTNDDDALATLLRKVSATVGLEGTGYTQDGVDKLIAKLTPEPPDAFPEVGGTEPTHTCESCGHRWS